MLFSVGIGQAFDTIHEEYDEKGRTQNLSDEYYRGAVYTVYFLAFSFIGRIKDFHPSNSPKQDFDYFVELFFAYYTHILTLLKPKISLAHLEAIKPILILHDNLFFGLIAYYKSIRGILCPDHDLPSVYDFHDWIFWDFRKRKKTMPIYAEYRALGENSLYTPTFVAAEHSLVDFLTPTDILIRILFGSKETLT
jgi:hypothetical protein